jgi:hypothetical protein
MKGEQKVTELSRLSMAGDEADRDRPQSGNTQLSMRTVADNDEKKNLIALNVQKDVEDPKVVQAEKKPEQAISQMNRYAQYDKFHPLNRAFPAIEGFKGPKSNRLLIP